MIVLSFASLFVVYLWRYGGFVNAVRAYHVRSEHWGFPVIVLWKVLSRSSLFLISS